MIGVRDDGSRTVLLGPTRLAGLARSVAAFESALLEALALDGAHRDGVVQGE